MIGRGDCNALLRNNDTQKCNSNDDTEIRKENNELNQKLLNLDILRINDNNGKIEEIHGGNKAGTYYIEQTNKKYARILNDLKHEDEELLKYNIQYDEIMLKLEEKVKKKNDDYARISHAFNQHRENICANAMEIFLRKNDVIAKIKELRDEERAKAKVKDLQMLRHVSLQTKLRLLQQNRQTIDQLHHSDNGMTIIEFEQLQDENERLTMDFEKCKTNLALWTEKHSKLITDFQQTNKNLVSTITSKDMVQQLVMDIGEASLKQKKELVEHRRTLSILKYKNKQMKEEQMANKQLIVNDYKKTCRELHIINEHLLHLKAVHEKLTIQSDRKEP